MPIAVPNKLGRAGITPAANPSPLAVPDFVGVGDRINRTIQPSGVPEALAALTGVGAAVYRQVEEVRVADEENAAKTAFGEDARTLRTPAELATALRKKLSDSTLSPEFRVAYRELAAGELAKRYDVAVRAEMEDVIAKAQTPDPKTGLYPDPPDAASIQNRVWEQMVGGADAGHLKSVFFRGALQANAGASNTQTAEAYNRSVKELQTKNSETHFANTAATHFSDVLSKAESAEAAAAQIQALLPQYGSEAHAAGFRDPRGLLLAAMRTALTEAARKSPEAALDILDRLDETEIAGVKLRNDVKAAPVIAALRNELETEQRRQDHAGSETAAKRRSAVEIKLDDVSGVSDLTKQADFEAVQKLILDPNSAVFVTAGEKAVALRMLQERRTQAIQFANANLVEIRREAGAAFSKAVLSGVGRAWLDAATHLPEPVRAELEAQLAEDESNIHKLNMGPGSVADTTLAWALNLPDHKAVEHGPVVEAFQTARTAYLQAAASKNPEAIKAAKTTFDAALATLQQRRETEVAQMRTLRAEARNPDNNLTDDMLSNLSENEIAAIRSGRTTVMYGNVNAAAKALRPIEHLFSLAERTTSRAGEVSRMRTDGEDEYRELQETLENIRSSPTNSDRPNEYRAKLESVRKRADALYKRLYAGWTGEKTSPQGPLFAGEGISYSDAVVKEEEVEGTTVVGPGLEPGSQVTEKSLSFNNDEKNAGNRLDFTGILGWNTANKIEDTVAALRKARNGDPTDLKAQSLSAWRAVAEATKEDSDPADVSNAAVWASVGRYVPMSAFAAGKVGDGPYAVALSPKDRVLSRGLTPNRTLLFASPKELLNWEQRFLADDLKAVAEAEAFLTFKGWQQGDPRRIVGKVLQAQRALLGMPEGVTAQPTGTGSAGSAAASETQPPTVAETQPTAASGATETRPESGPTSKPSEAPKDASVALTAATAASRPSGRPKRRDEEIYVPPVPEALKEFVASQELRAARDRAAVEAGQRELQALRDRAALSGREPPIGSRDVSQFEQAAAAARQTRRNTQREQASAATVEILKEAEASGIKLTDFMVLKPLSIYRPDKLRWQPLFPNLTETELDYFRRLNNLRAAFDDE